MVDIHYTCNITQLKSLYSAVCILISLSLHFASRTTNCVLHWAKIKQAYLHWKSVINPNAYPYQQLKMEKKYQVPHFFIFSRKYLHVVQTFHGVQLRIFHLGSSCTRCLWSDIFLTKHEFFRYLIKRKTHLKAKNHCVKVGTHDATSRRDQSQGPVAGTSRRDQSQGPVAGTSTIVCTDGLMFCSQCSSASHKKRESAECRRRARWRANSLCSHTAVFLTFVEEIC